MGFNTGWFGGTHTHTYPYFRNPTPGIMDSQSIKSHRFCCFQSILGSISSIIHKKILLSRSLFLLNGCEVRWLQITSSPGVGWSQKARSEHVGTVSSGSAASDMTRRLCWKQILPKSPKGQGSKEGKHNGCKVDCFTHGIPICKTKPLLPSKMSWVPSTKVLNHALINWGYLDGLLRRRPDEPAKSVGSKCFVKVGPMGQSWRPNIASYIDRHGGTVLATGFAWILDIATDCDCRPTHVKMIQESFKKVSRCHDSSWPWH